MHLLHFVCHPSGQDPKVRLYGAAHTLPKLTESSQIEGARFLILSWYPLYPSQYHEPKLIYFLPMDLKHKGIPGFLLALGHCSIFGISPLVKPPEKKQFMDSKFYLKFQ